MLFCANCSRKSPIPDESYSVADASAAPPATVSVDVADASIATVSAWTDPPLVEKLRDDCGFDPRKLNVDQKEELFGNAYGATELTCLGSGFDQSCVYDPCFETAERTCKAGCLNDCSSCDDKCVSSCFSCKATCTDDACRNACAPTCASCKQACITAQDRCRSGTCGQVYGDCRKRLDATWKSQGCNAICTQYEPCRTSCFEKLTADKSGTFDHNACIAKCKNAFKTSCDLGLCGGKYSMGIDMK